MALTSPHLTSLYHPYPYPLQLTLPTTGYDFNGNTFWIFREAGGYMPVNSWRRIVKAPTLTHMSDVKVPPLWHQWLRHVRDTPPSVDEQVADVHRQTQTRQLAQLADARWAAKPRFEDMTDHERQLLEESRKTPAVRERVETDMEAVARAKARAGVHAAEKKQAPEKTHARQEPAQEPGKDGEPQPVQRAQKPVSEAHKNKNKIPLPPHMVDPWVSAKNPGDNWQPQAWTPTPGSKRA